MKALVFTLSIPRAVGLKLAGTFIKSLFYRSPLAMIKLVDVPEPRLISPDWVKIKTKMCGFCGSDLNLIFLRESLMASPFTSAPAIMGHEVCGEIVETGPDVHGFNIGDIVTVVPMLNCTVRGIFPECRACQEGKPGNCENVASGSLAPGMFIGVCRDAGGGFAEYMVAHKSQIFRIPEGVSVKSAALVEPFAVALQAVLDNRPRDVEKILVIGGGVIGSMIVKAIRGLGIRCHITVVEPSTFAAEYAKKAGADHVSKEEIIKAALEVTGACAYKSLGGERILQGGFNRIYDTVGNSSTIQKGLVSMAFGGTLSMVGICNKISFDPTPLWLKLQTIKAAFGYGYNTINGTRKHAFEIALELLKDRKVDVEDMLTHTFPIEKFRDMIEVNLHKGKNQALKTALLF